MGTLLGLRELGGKGKKEIRGYGLKEISICITPAKEETKRISNAFPHSSERLEAEEKIS